MAPKISVVIASYNHQDYIAETLKSLEEQTFGDFEVIVIDDGSTDKTVEVVRGFPSRAQIFTQKNQGVAAAINRGISLAKGEYICLVDSDDTVLPDRFARQVAILDKSPQIGMAFGDALIIDSIGRQIGMFSDVYPVIQGDMAEKLLTKYCFISTQTVMVRRRLLERTGPFEKPNPVCDYIKWIEIAYLSKAYYDPKPLACWRRHKESVSKKANKEKSYAQMRIGVKKILRKYPQLNGKTGMDMIKRFSRTYFLTAVWLAAKGQSKRAKKYYCKAVTVYPYSPINICGLMLSVILPAKCSTVLHSYVRARKLPW